MNQLRPDDRMNCTWDYVLLGQETFYSMSKSGANTKDILEYAGKNLKSKLKGTLREYVGDNEY